jgi:hypothetical protein
MDQNKGYFPPANNANVTSSPLITDGLSPVSNNQVRPSIVDIENLKNALKSDSNFVTCPYCRNQAITRTQKKFSCINCLCCVVTSGILWLFFQACRGKDINCYDADHYCNRCNNNLASYKAC